MGNTVARSHIRDADRGVAKATRVNTRHNSTNPSPPPLPIPTPSESATSSPDEKHLPEPNPAFPQNTHSFTFGNDPLDKRPVKRRARHVSAEAAFVDASHNPLPDLTEPPPGASPAEVHAARTETPRADKPPRARKVVSFNENVHVVTYPYEASNHSSAELPAITRYPEQKHARRRSRSVFRLLSRAPNDHQCIPPDACCGLRIASDAQVVYHDQPNSDERMLSFDSAKDLYESGNGIVVSYERPYPDAVADDFDYVRRKGDQDQDDDDTFSLSDAHPSCDAIEEPEAIGDQLLSREQVRDAPAFDIAPLWQRLKRVDELDAVAKNSFLRDSARRRYVHDGKPPRPPRHDTQGISHSKSARSKTRRQEAGSSTSPDESIPPAHGSVVHSRRTTGGKPPKSVHRELQPQCDDEENFKNDVVSASGETSPSKSIATSSTTQESSTKPFSLEVSYPNQQTVGVTKDPDPSQERKLPAPARSRATSAGSIQKHMASFTTESAASATDRDTRDDPPIPDDDGQQGDTFFPYEIVQTSSALTVEPKSERNLPGPKECDLPTPGGIRIRSEPFGADSDAQPLATTIQTSRSARVQPTYLVTPDEPLPQNIPARATVRPVEDPTLPKTGLGGENISHSWARLNDLSRKRDELTPYRPRKNFSSQLRSRLEKEEPMEFPEDAANEEIASTENLSDKASTVDLDLDPLSLPSNDDLGMAPCPPVQGYAPVAGVYYGTSSPSNVDPGSPRIGLADTAEMADYPEYEMLNGNVNDESVFESEPNTPIFGTNSNWSEPFEETFFGIEDDFSRPDRKTPRGSSHRDRNGKQPVPEVLLHDWSGNTPVEPNIEMVDSAPNSRSSSSHLFSEEGQSKASKLPKSPKREGGNMATMLSKRINVDISALYQNTALKAGADTPRGEKINGISSSSVAEKIGAEKAMSSLRRSRSDRVSPTSGEIDGGRLRGHGRGKRGDHSAKKFSLSNTEAWVSSDYEVKEIDHRAKSDAHERGRGFFPALPPGFPQDPKLHDFQIAVERKSASDVGYRRGLQAKRGASFAERETMEGRTGIPGDWRDGKPEHGQKRLAMGPRRRRPSDVDSGVAASEGTLRGMMGRLVSGMHKRLVSQN